MAPEQIEHPHLVDHRADIYSLGVVFYEMLTGELPLGRFPPPSRKVHVDVRLDEVVLKTLEKEPELRYQHASEVKIDVETISSGTPAPGPAAEVVKDTEQDDGTKAVRDRVWIPAVGLLVAGGINCLAVVGLVLAALSSVLAKSFSGQLARFEFLPGAAQAVVLAVTVGYAVLVVLGGWNLMQLRSRRLALWGSVLALFPFSAGSVVGLPMGIWALIVMRNEQVKAAFGQKRIEVAVPPNVRDFAVSTAGDVKEAFERGKAEVEKIIARNEAGAEQSSGLPRQSDASAPGKTRKLAIGSFVLGFVSILMTSLAPGRIDWLVLVFPPGFIAIFLGVLVMRRIRPYRHHIGDTVLVIVGVVTGSMSVLSLFGRVM
jgi:hypothetical protein